MELSRYACTPTWRIISLRFFGLCILAGNSLRLPQNSPVTVTKADLRWCPQSRILINMNIDERIEALTARHEALTMNLELLSKDREKDREDIKTLLATAKQDGENIRGLVRIAEFHHERLVHLEGGAA